MRKRVDFWLDDNRPSDVKLWKIVQKMRSKRVFSQTVKDGILIMNQLLAGKTDLLFEKFPWIVDKALASVPPPSAPDSGALERVAIMAAQQVVLSMPSLPATTPVAAPLKSSTSAAPLPQVVTAQVASADEIIGNFMAGMFQ